MTGGARTSAPPSRVSGLAPALGKEDLCLPNDDPVDAQEVGTISGRLLRHPLRKIVEGVEGSHLGEHEGR